MHRMLGKCFGGALCVYLQSPNHSSLRVSAKCTLVNWEDANKTVTCGILPIFGCATCPLCFGVDFSNIIEAYGYSSVVFDALPTRMKKNAGGFLRNGWLKLVVSINDVSEDEYSLEQTTFSGTDMGLVKVEFLTSEMIRHFLREDDGFGVAAARQFGFLYQRNEIFSPHVSRLLLKLQSVLTYSF